MVEQIGGITYFTVAEFSRIVRVAQSTVERWITEGKIVYWQVETSRHIRIPESELSRHLHHPKK